MVRGGQLATAKSRFRRVGMVFMPTNYARLWWAQTTCPPYHPISAYGLYQVHYSGELKTYEITAIIDNHHGNIIISIYTNGQYLYIYREMIMFKIIAPAMLGLMLLAPVAMAEKLDGSAVVEAFPVESSVDLQVDVAEASKNCEEAPYGDDAWGSDPALNACGD